MIRSRFFVKRLVVAVGISLLGALAVSLASLGMLYRVLQANDRTLLEDLRGIVIIEKLRSAVQYRVASYRGYILGGGQRFEDEYRQADEGVGALLQKLGGVLNGLGEVVSMELIQHAENDYREAIARGVVCQEKGLPVQELLQCIEEDITPKRIEFIRVIERLQSEKEKEITAVKEAVAQASSRYLFLIMAVMSAALFLSMGAAFIVVRYLGHQAQDLARANRDLEEFSSIVAHDLKAPLYTISGFLNLLREEYREQLDSQGKKYVDLAEQGAGRLSQFVDRLLAYSRLGKQKISIRPVDLGEVVAEVTANLKATIDSSGAEIKCESMPCANADKSQMAQLFQNLIGNSIKYRGDQRPRVTLSAQAKGLFWEISVKDNGVGFDPDLAESIFEPFHRLHAMENVPGTGLGLSVCKKIVEQHGGRIWATSIPGCGATFYFTIPAA